MVAIAIGVSVVTAGAVAGAAGSVASQTFGVATGPQKGFDFRDVAPGAPGGAVGGAISSARPAL